MKKLLNLLTLSLLASLLIFVGCGGGGDDDDDDDVLSPEEIEAAKLVATWGTLSSVTLDAVDVEEAGEWSGFTLTVTGSASGGTYSTTGSGDATVWPGSGNWTFSAGSNGRKISRSDGIEMDVTSSATSLLLTFTIAEGRTQGITGTWVFTLTP